MHFIITGDGYTSPLIPKAGTEIVVLTEQELANSNQRFTEDDLIYVPSESALEIVLARSDHQLFIEAVNSLKDKYRFRQLTSKLFPDFFYRKIPLAELAELKLPAQQKFMVKPVKGFFGTAVKEIDSDSDLDKISREISSELEINSQYFSEAVLSQNELIVEQYIPGEEYAVDLYYDAEGKAQIINIYYHPFPLKTEYFHVLYYTNSQIYTKFKQQIQTIFQELNAHLQICNFPIHAEFKYYDGKLLPIEMNPLRYGGFGLADLTYHAFGINPFTAFFRSKSMDWPKIWQKHSEQNFAWVLAYNSAEADLTQQAPQHQKFQEYLGDILHYQKMDHLKNPVFALAYLQDKNSENLERFLSLEFADFFQ
ncbi:MAG: ATP-grasp domain-containing protein [Candidatus Cloacimonadales bacterium]